MRRALNYILGSAWTLLFVAAPLAADEIKLQHINDLWSFSPRTNDFYTGTATIAVTHDRWTVDLTEYLFTDRDVNQERFDETYLTVEREFRPGEKPWLIRARVGAVHVGEGLVGESFQNWVHRLINQEEVELRYVEDGTHLVVGGSVERPVVENARFTLTPGIQLESAAFKRHALVSLAAHWDAGRGFGVLAETGYRWTDSNFLELARWVKDEPTLALGASYKRLLDVRWTQNYLGLGGRHWHLTARFQLKSRDERKRGRYSRGSPGGS
jgi:hypothetical protein